MKTNNQEGKELSFPYVELDTYSGKPCNQHFGLTKRELFAAMAMQGILANPEITKNHKDLNIEQAAIKCADALIAELNRE